MKGIALAALGLGVYMLYKDQGKRQVDALKYLTITPGGVKADLSNILAPKFKISLDLFNPNDTDINITALYGIIRDNSGKKLASFTSPNSFIVVRENSGTTSINLVVNGLNVLGFLLQAFTKKQMYTFIAEGLVRCSSYDQKFSQSIIIGSL